MDTSAMLGELYQARFDGLKDMAQRHGLSKAGPVEALRARLIQHLVFPDWDFSPAGLRSIANSDLGEILGRLRHQEIRAPSKPDDNGCSSILTTTRNPWPLRNSTT